MINLVYWSEKNYGDALSPYIIEKLSGQKTQLKRAYINKFRKFIRGIIFLSKEELTTILFPWQNNVLGVGSIITCGNKRSTVWGAGFMSNSGVFEGKKICAVRGPFTAKRLTEQGYKYCDVHGDPALLLPLLINKPSSKKYKLSIIPHWTEYNFFKNKYGDRYNIVDLRTSDVERITKEIGASEYILSTSLHGIIVGHAYGVPSLWIKDGFIHTDGFKFSDYFSSVGIVDYKGFENIEEILSDEASWLYLFREHADKTLIKKQLDIIQKKLIEAAPFPVLEKYKNMLDLT